MQDRRNDYAKQVKYANASSLPPAGAKKVVKSIEKEPSKMQKANDFARNIPKPPQKVLKNQEDQETLNKDARSQLDYRFERHDSYRSIIEEIKSKID